MILKGRKDLISGLLLMVMPTIFITYPLLLYISDHYSLLFIDSYLLTSLFSGGMVAAYIYYTEQDCDLYSFSHCFYSCFIGPIKVSVPFHLQNSMLTTSPIGLESMPPYLR